MKVIYPDVESIKLPLIKRLHDGALEEAQRYGRDEIWPIDILHALAETPDTAGVLHRKGLDPHRLMAHIRTIQTYSWSTLLQGQTGDERPSVAKKELLDEVTQFKQRLKLLDQNNEIFELIKEKHPENAQKMWTDFLDDMAEVALDLNDFRSLEQMGSRAAIASVFVSKLASVLDSQDVRKAGETVLTLLGRVAVVRDSLDSFFEIHREAVDMSPTMAVDFVTRGLDEKHLYLLHHNGLIAPDGYESALRLPNDGMLKLLNNTYDLAHSRHDRDVRPEHLLLTLLEDRKVAAFLHDAGVDDLTVFERLVDRKLFGEPSDAEKFRFHPEITYQLDEIIRASVAGETPKSGASDKTQPHQPRANIGKQVKAMIDQQDLTRLGIDKTLVDGGLVPTALFLCLTETEEIKTNLDTLKDWKGVKEKFETKFIASVEREDTQSILGKGREERGEGFKVSDHELDEFLGTFAENLVAQARKGKIKPVIGREKELDNIVRALMRRDRANPVLIGDSGVGKSAILEGLAHRIASGNVPVDLIGTRLYRLDLEKMEGGMFSPLEAKLRPIVDGVLERNASHDQPLIVLAVDEVSDAMERTYGGGMEPNSQLKRFLNSPHGRFLSTITPDDYSASIEKSPKTAHTLTLVTVEEPLTADTVKIVAGLIPEYAKHHDVKIDAEAIAPRVVALSSRYVPGRKHPEKDLEVIDQAAVDARVSGLTEVTEDHLLRVVARLAKLPEDFLRASDSARYLLIESKIGEEVIDQPKAATALGNSVVRSAARMNNPRKPLGIFAFVGPTGVGKNETARVLAKHLFGSEDALARIDMSEYMEKHSLSRLIGSPPSYVGYGEEGSLTGPVRQRPHSVIALDEFEKAHPDIFSTLMPIFEEGIIKDMASRDANFRQAIIVVNMNLNANDIFSRYLDNKNPFSWDASRLSDMDHMEIEQDFKKELKKRYPLEFLNRLDEIVVFYPLSSEAAFKIAGLEVAKTQEQARQEHKIELVVDEGIIRDIAHRGHSIEYGARQMKRLVESEINTPLSRAILTASSVREPVRHASFRMPEGGSRLYTMNVE